MAITQTGSTLSFNVAAANTGTVSSTITVPSDAEIVIATVASFRGLNNFFTSGVVTFTKGGSNTAMTTATATSDANSGLMMGGLWYLVAPDTGTNKSLTFDWVGVTPSEDVHLFSVTFWKGIDIASPVRDADAAQASDTPYTTPTLTAQSGDLILAWVYAFAGTGEGSINTWSNLTLLSQLTRNGTVDGALATGSPSGNTTVAASTDTNITDGGIVAIVLKPAAATTDGVGNSAGIATASAVGSAIAILMPDADTTDGGWLTDTGGTSLFAAIDESPASDTDYIVSSDTDTDTCEIRLSDPSTTVARPFSVAYRYKRIGSDDITLRVALMEGATQRASWDTAVTSGIFTDAEQFLTAPEFAAITDFTDLRVRFTAIRAAEDVLTLEGDFSGDLTLEGDFSGSLLLEGT